MKMTNKLVKISILCVFLSACGGSGDKQNGATPVENQTQFSLDVTVSGVSTPIKFNWLGESYNLTNTQVLTKTAATYQAPTFEHPEHHVCENSHEQISATEYSYSISCEAETLWQLTVDMADFAEEVSFAWFDEEYSVNSEQTLSHWSLAYQAPTNVNFSNEECGYNEEQLSPSHYNLVVNCPPDHAMVKVPESLPYAVTVMVAGEEYEFHEAGEFELDKPYNISEFELVRVAGAAECSLNSSDENTFQLSCVEYTLIDGDNGIVLLFSDGTTRALAGSEAKSLISPIVFHDDIAWFVSSDGIERIDSENTLVLGSLLELDGALDMDFSKSNDVLSGLKSDGLYRYGDNGWVLQQPFATLDVLPDLYRSGPLLSVELMDENQQAHIYQHHGSNSSGTFTFDERYHKSTATGVLHSNGFGLMTFWTEDKRLGYQLAVSSAAHIVDFIDADTSSSIRQNADDEQQLVRIFSGAVQRLEETSTMNIEWVSQFATQASEVVAMGELLWLGKIDAESDFMLLEQVRDQEEELLAQLQSQTSSSAPFYTQFHFVDSEQTKSLLPTEATLGWTLLWQANNEDTLGSIYATDGSKLVLFQTGQSLQQFGAYQVSGVATRFIVISNGSTSVIVEK
ncbi:MULTISPECIES: hypothetical protein [unclassified Pseudoalteromonas]|uniref:hypothetical protein n=1 Tax=unclassified Pseudoalteromonas TaxID=194690 RepID=UPI003015118D